jgi:hypothetical protein
MRQHTASASGSPASALLWPLAAFVLYGALTGALSRRSSEPEGAIRGLLAAFHRFPVVAVGMSHSQQAEADFSLALVRDPAFPSVVNDIVVECGNPLYQPALNRYVAGDSVPLEVLAPVWRPHAWRRRVEPRRRRPATPPAAPVSAHSVLDAAGVPRYQTAGHLTCRTAVTLARGPS